MSLDLSARQRAMLQEMGVRVWAPTPTPPAAAAPPAAAPTPAAARHAPPPAASAASAPPPPRPAAAPTPAPSATASPPDGPAWQLHPPRAVYPDTPSDAGSTWLLLVESADPADPLAGDAGQLLDQMLRALRLHRPPQAFVACLQRPPRTSSASGVAAPGDVHQQAQQALAQLRPAVVLALGLAPARLLLGGQEPLGKLRAHAHALADGTPLVVSYDPAYLLRAPDAKAGAWADLCRALALASAGGAPQAMQ